MAKMEIPEKTEGIDYGNKLGLDFNANFSFCCGVAFPVPVWYKELSAAKKRIWTGYRRFGDVMYFLLFVSNLIRIVQGYHDIRVFVTCIGTMSYIVCVTIKLIIFRREVAIINGVLNSLLRISRDLHRNPIAEPQYLAIQEKFARQVRIFGYGKFAAISTAVTTLAIFETTIGYVKPEMRKLPMPGWFPFEPLTDYGFITSCLFQYICYMSFLIKDIAIDLIFMNVMVAFNSYLIYLRILFQRISQTRTVGKISEISQKKEENLIWWIKQYQSVLRTIDDFKIISNPYLFAKYVSVGIILFFGGVLVTSNVVYDFVQQMIVLAINSSNLLQLYIFSLIGDKITENAGRIAEGGFDIEMVTERKSIKTLYLYTLQRSKKLVLIRFGSINPLSVHTFGQIVKMCFSYFTTIVQVRSERDDDVQLNDWV